MKLLFCDVCTDIVRLIIENWRTCKCGLVGGQYNIDQVTATVGGKAPRVFGIANPFFHINWLTETEENKINMREKHYPESHGQDIWWGNYEGDVQLFRILSANGPRLVTTSGFSKHPDDFNKDDHPPLVYITVKDRRKYWIGDKLRVKQVHIPYYTGTNITEKKIVKILKPKQEKHVAPTD